MSSSATDLAVQKMQERLAQLAQTAQTSEAKSTFEGYASSFLRVFRRYLDIKAHGSEYVDWDKIRLPSEEMVVDHSTLPVPSPDEIKALLKKLVVAKLNGGLGTTMGCTGPKSHIEAHSGKTFLDLIVEQVSHLNQVYGSDVPLVLMHSFNTHNETLQILPKYNKFNVRIHTFLQSKHPRFDADTLVPLAKVLDSPDTEWYPPGHVEFYTYFVNTGLAAQFIKEGREIVFLSNSDNLGALVDVRILHAMLSKKLDFAMEVTPKTKADVKGGTLIDMDGRPKLLELAQVPPAKIPEFESIKKFKIFNTNNLWARIAALQPTLAAGAMDKIDLIVNKKTFAGQNIIQLEVAAGATIQFFKNACGIVVPRSRFLPVKSTNDLMLLQSNLHILKDGSLIANPERPFATELPAIHLGESFKKVADFLRRFSGGVPNLLDLDHLTVTGDVCFGRRVTLRGTVIIVAPHGSHIDIPSGAVLENKVVTGSLSIVDL
jgi:UTP--glucose-1-phosphate uridylyltransferase